MPFPSNRTSCSLIQCLGPTEHFDWTKGIADIHYNRKNTTGAVLKPNRVCVVLQLCSLLCKCLIAVFSRQKGRLHKVCHKSVNSYVKIDLWFFLFPHCFSDVYLFIVSPVSLSFCLSVCVLSVIPRPHCVCHLSPTVNQTAHLKQCTVYSTSSSV